MLATGKRIFDQSSIPIAASSGDGYADPLSVRVSNQVAVSTTTAPVNNNTDGDRLEWTPDPPGTRIYREVSGMFPSLYAKRG
jgi:hypothetical protein